MLKLVDLLEVDGNEIGTTPSGRTLYKREGENYAYFFHDNGNLVQSDIKIAGAHKGGGPMSPFTESCYDMNTFEEIEAALTSDADETDMKTWGLSEDEYFTQLRHALILKTDKARLAAKELGLIEHRGNYSYYFQNEMSNDDLIGELQERAHLTYGEGEAELFVFFDDSCINRQGDEYFINEDVSMLDHDYLKSVGCFSE